MPETTPEQTATNQRKDRLELDLMQEVYNHMVAERRLIQRHLDPKRDIASECGYVRTEDLTAAGYKEVYERDSIATRVVEILPNECWKTTPRIFETEDVEINTPFEEAWSQVCRDLSGCEWFADEECNPVFEYLERADKRCGIGRYATILLGVNDGKELREPLDITAYKRMNSRPLKLVYLRVLDETECWITKLDADQTSPRYGQPIEYQALLHAIEDPNISSLILKDGNSAMRDTTIHWTRLVHIVDNAESNDIFGAPRMRCVWNRLYDLFKLYGGSAEMFWKGAFPGISIETHPQLGPDVTFDRSLRDQLESYGHGLQRYLALKGASANSLAPQVADPSQHIDCELDAICIAIECPKRIFMGSERGELASTQDADAWNGRIRHRQIRQCTPRVIVPFVDRLIKIGVLPVPEKLGVDWPDLAALTDTEKADIGNKETDSLTKYAAGNLESYMDFQDYLVHVLRMDRTKAEEIAANREASLQYMNDLEEKFGPEEEEFIDPQQTGQMTGKQSNFPPTMPAKSQR